LVSATNGKSTTSALLAAGASHLGTLCLNREGGNMEEGLVASLDAQRGTEYAVLETDEAYLKVIAEATRPEVIVLMNLTRDFLERGIEAKKLAQHFKDTLAVITWPCTVIANVDDPLVAWSVKDFSNVVWVAGQDRWRADAVLCRDCLAALEWDGPHWSCPSCGFSRPEPAWTFDDDAVAHGPGIDEQLTIAVPGRAAISNAVFALAGAVALGADPARAVSAMSSVLDVDGRYQPKTWGQHEVRLLLAKNPASWDVTLELLGKSESQPAFAVYGRGGGGGHDTSMMWDAPFEELAGRQVLMTGSRRADLAQRLAVAGGTPLMGSDDPLESLKLLPSGKVDIVCNWPAFVDLATRLGRS
jgi:UDP-N-acetylmuramyl tripeptide synthase